MAWVIVYWAKVNNIVGDRRPAGDGGSGLTKVAFVSFRLKAQDGVSVETEKWIRIFEGWGFDICRVAGYIHEPEENDYVLPELNSQDPLVESFREKAFRRGCDRHELRMEMALLSESVERALLPVLSEIAPDVIVAANVFSLPLHIPLTMVLYRHLQEENIPCIAHHHDFFWEDEGFTGCGLEELIASHFPPLLPQARHVTVSSRAREELEARSGITAICIRNCFDFSSPREKDTYNDGLRHNLGIGEDEIMLLQPTRASLDKGIDRAISFAEEFTRESHRTARLVVSGACDQGFEEKFEKMCRDSETEVLHVPGWLGSGRGRLEAQSSYDIFDAYAQADLIIYPVAKGSFGNPVMESVMHRRLALVGDYPALNELRAFGFQFLSLDDHAVGRTLKLLDYPVLMEEMADRNFEIGRRNFSLQNLKEELAELVSAVVFR